MRKAWIGFITAIIFNGSALGATSTSCDPTWVTAPCYHGGFTFGVGLLFWQPSANNLDYALRFPRFNSSTDLSAILEDGSFESIEPTDKGDFLYNIGYLFPCSNKDIMLLGANFHHDFKDTTTNPTSGFLLFSTFPTSNIVGPNPNGVPSPAELTFFSPAFQYDNIGVVTNLLIPIPINLANARAEFEDNFWDAEFGQTFYLGNRFKLRCLMALRYADLGEKLKVNYLGTGSALLETVEGAGGATGLANFVGVADYRVVQTSRFKGGGPRFGLNLAYHICNGFGLVFEGSGALLVGNIEAELQQHLDYTIRGTGVTGIVAGTTFIDNIPGRDRLTSSPERIQISPNLDGKIALDYTYEVCYLFWSRVTVELGYRVNHFWNSTVRLNGPVLADVNLLDPELASRPVAASIDPQVSATSLAGPYFNIQIQL